MKTPDRISWQNYSYAEGKKMWRNGRGTCGRLDNIPRRLELFYFSGQVSKFFQGTETFDDLTFDASTWHSWRALENCVTMSQSPLMR
jgi:hypothetical protein